MLDRQPSRPHAIRNVIAAAITVALLASGPLAAPAVGVDAALARYPYLTDLVGSHVTVSWATTSAGTAGSVTYGTPSGCDGHAEPATSRPITVGLLTEYQWTATLSGLAANTTYCYRVTLDGIDLLGADASPRFVSQVASGSSTPYSFAVFGDWGQVDDSGANPDQANLMAQIAGSGARFAVTVGDTGYPSGSETVYGDLLQSGGNTSAIFGPTFWPVPGRSIPLFNAFGNHGYTLGSIGLGDWPTPRAVTSSGGTYEMNTYCCLNATYSASYPDDWYAFDAGNARFYVLEAAWSDQNAGTADVYTNDYDYHWAPGTPQYTWLQNDLATHPREVKFAFWHYPMYADNPTEGTDSHLQGSGSLEGLLAQYDVSIGFSGHAHMYQRNRAPAGGIVTYVTGGGGAKLEPIGPCTSLDAYGIGWSSSGGSACGSAPTPAAASRVYHFLLVTVDGTTVTVTPTDSTGATFDAKTYDFRVPDTQAPSVPGGVTATGTSPGQVDVVWNPSTDNVGVTGYNVFRDGAKIGSTTTATQYADTNLDPSTTYSYTVKARDAAGNWSAASSAAAATTPPNELRLAGSDRYATAAALSAWHFSPGVPVTYIATGTNFPDALAGGPAAGRSGGPVLLTAPTSLPSATRTELTRLHPGRIVVLGGSGAVSDGVLAALHGYTSGTVTRIAGPDRYATAAALSAATFPAGVAVAYVATGANFPDALAGGAVAARGSGAPILLARVGDIPGATAAELKRLHPGRIVVLGGSGVIGNAVLAALASYTTGSVTRLAGADRYATAVAISAATFAAGSVGTAFAATGLNFPDALAAGPIAGALSGPVLLVPGTSVPASVAAELDRLRPATVAVAGGSSVVTDQVLTEISQAITGG